ncbi:helix-turn-helix domain-containing protein [Paenibacillus amylolyticus]|uniref:helix-turn-helix domain-containing protein n=1 Tax=Paenibacillus TaxID=44249 RepID=UPI001F4062D1|nr:helix-turn-helix domain-containing protein [Paenibacillus xylanexedens]MCF7753423.1 DNA-binding protein [Paenibacillus xylanexedens]
MKRAKEDYELVLLAEDIQEIMRMGRKATYDFLKDPPFPVRRVGGRGEIKISRDAFFEWLEKPT